MNGSRFSHTVGRGRGGDTLRGDGGPSTVGIACDGLRLLVRCFAQRFPAALCQHPRNMLVGRPQVPTRCRGGTRIGVAHDRAKDGRGPQQRRFAEFGYTTRCEINRRLDYGCRDFDDWQAVSLEVADIWKYLSWKIAGRSGVIPESLQSANFRSVAGRQVF